jgi:hypothetical protein
MANPNFCIVLLDLTTDVTPKELKPTQILDDLSQALSDQICLEFADSYGLVSVLFRIITSPNDRQINEIAINFRDTIPEAPDALAYHQEINGVPDIEVGVDLFGSLADSDPLTSGVSHEVLEMIRNPGANGWYEIRGGSAEAGEECDVVQNTGYKSKKGLPISNFLLPSYFMPGSKGPWDMMGMMKSQDDLSHGYAIRSDSVSGVHQEFGLVVRDPKKFGMAIHENKIVYAVGGDKLTEKQRKRKTHKWSRTHRLGVRL